MLAVGQHRISQGLNYMPSFIWKRSPQEAFENPYEYEAQEQFYREASNLIKNLYSRLNSEKHRYFRDEKSVKKAIWLLQMDALDSLFDCLDALKTKRHRVAGKLFRDIEETLDLAAFFFSGTERSNKLMEKWFNDEIIPNRGYRNYIEKTKGKEAANAKAKHYSALSKFTHRSHRIIMDGYSLGANERLVHDRVALTYNLSKEPGVETFLVVPNTISAYCAILAMETLLFCEELHQRGSLFPEEVTSTIDESFEAESVPRRFTSMEMLLDMKIDADDNKSE
jgi:hypothetical protein